MVTHKEIAELADFIDRLIPLTYGGHYGVPDHEQETIWHLLDSVLQVARRRLVMYLAYTDDMLVGTENCNECGEVYSVVTKINREPELLIVTTKGAFYPEDEADSSSYFRLPGSDAYGEHALVEIARQRAAIVT